MASWDNKEKELFRIDAETLKENLINDVDTIQSEKINQVKSEISDIRSCVSKSNNELSILALDFFKVSNQVDDLKIKISSDFYLLRRKHAKKLRVIYYTQAILLILVLIAILLAIK